MGGYGLARFDRNGDLQMSDTLICYTKTKAGVFSRFFHQGLCSLLGNNDGKTHENIIFREDNFYDEIFDSNLKGNEITLKGKPKFRTHVFDDSDKKALNELTGKLKFKQSFLDKVNELEKKYITGKNILGVHLRLSDLNTKHLGISNVTWDEYRKAIDKHLENDTTIDQIFVATDNVVSLETIKKHYPALVSYIPDLIFRDHDEHIQTWEMASWPLISNNKLRDKYGLSDEQKELYKKYKPKDVFLEAFCEMWCLSKTHHLINRASALSNCSIAFSNTIQDVHCLGIPIEVEEEVEEK